MKESPLLFCCRLEVVPKERDSPRCQLSGVFVGSALASPLNLVG